MGIRPSRVIVEYEGDYQGMTVIDVKAAGELIGGVFWGDPQTLHGEVERSSGGSGQWMWQQATARAQKLPCWIDSNGVLHCPT